MTASRLSRRALLGASAAAAGAAAMPGQASAARRADPPGSSGVTLRWLGNNAWDIRFGDTTILVDPWLTRFRTGTYTGGSRPDTPLVVDPEKIDPYLDRAGLILLCHGHFDHITDVPHIANRFKASVLGTESHHNMLRAMGADPAYLSTVEGGEYLQYSGFTVRVISSLHSVVGDRRMMPFPGTRPGPGPFEPPKTIADLVEGGTLAYELTIADRFSILVLSTANYIEHELAGLTPDLVLLPAGGGTIHDYVGRLMRVLKYPRLVVPTHWDDFDEPLAAPAKDWGGLAALRAAVAAASPHTEFRVVDHLESVTP